MGLANLIFGGFAGIFGTSVTGTSLDYLDFWIMQIKKHTFLDFAERTDILATVLDCDVQDLGEALGFSRASLFAYRAGKVNITAKAWNKLEAAEIKAGIRQSLYETRIGDSVSATPNIVSQLDDESIVRRMEKLELEVAELKAVVLKIRNAVNFRSR